MFGGCVVDDHIHDHLQAPLMALFQKPVKILHSAELFIDRLIVADVIPIVIVRRLVQRGEPDRGRPEIPDVIQF